MSNHVTECIPIKEKLRYGWTFSKQPVLNGQIPDDPTDLIFEPVLIPHDWLIKNVQNLYEDSVGWYKTVLHIDKPHDYYTALRFEGVYMDSTIYVNKTKVFEWKYGYSTFEVPVDEYLQEGDNEILVKVVHLAPNSRWYSGAGIYRPVYLIRKNRQRFLPDGIYIHSERDKSGYVSVITAETDTTACNENARIRAWITDASGDTVTEAVTALPEEEIIISNQTAKEWSLTAPNLYYLQIELFDVLSNKVYDRDCIRFGYRTLTFTTDRGFFLNDEYVKIQGAALHHDLGSLGSAVNKTAIRRQLKIMKEMGVNAIRSSHNMPATELVELCDEMGFLLQNEAFDCWKKSKTEYDYARFFEAWVEKDVASWIRRDRNYPCVIMWSIGNEIYDTHADESGKETMEYLISLVKIHDPKQNARVTLASNYLTWENTQKCADVIKLIGYNYTEKLYDIHHEKYPDWIIYGSETASLVQSRGIYHFPYAKEILADDDRQCSGLLNSITSWGAPSIEYCLTKDRDTKYSLGQFIWTGIDYIGEPTPYHTKNSYFGQADTAGFLKDSYYMYQAAWTDYKENPMVHIFPYWDFNEGQLIDIRVCSNAPLIKLFFNGDPIGQKEIDRLTGTGVSGEWQLPYQKGELKAVAYDENGTVIAEDVQRSFSDADRIVLSVDRSELRSDDESVLFLTVTVEDREGNPVHNANNRIELTVQGEGALLGTDNGDSTDMDEYTASSRRLFGGKLLAIVRSTGKKGTIRILANSPGLSGAMITLPVDDCCTDEYTIETLNRMEDKNADIPIRKLEIITQGSRVLGPERTELNVEVKTYPENASPKKIVWRVCDDAGVDSLFAFIKQDEEDMKKAVVTVKGDGNFRIRAMCENISGSLEILSQVECMAEGIGTLCMNPYNFIYASQCTLSKAIGNGNERGISTSRDTNSYVVFENVDFGKFGSKEVTIPVFSFGGIVPFKFWEGIPYEKGSRVIGELDYTLPGVWNTYVPDTFTLNKRLKGITTFAIELTNTKVHIKGFSFTKEEKAYAKLYAAEADAVYGDSYQVEGDCVNGIGNNVTLVFEDMDFGDSYADCICIKGYTPHKVNNIRLLSETDADSVQETIEFPYTEGKWDLKFKIKKKTGKQRISFVFLPGSAFDFESFYFGKDEEEC